MIGFRVWQVAGRADGSGPYLLRSPWQNVNWQDKRLRANDSPDPENSIGIYARSRYATEPPYRPASEIPVRGTVYLSGRVVEHEDGTLRAEEAEVISLNLISLSGRLMTMPQSPQNWSMVVLQGQHSPWLRPLDLQPRELLAQLLKTYDADILWQWPWDDQRGD